jgi:hypothetical protein
MSDVFEKWSDQSVKKKYDGDLQKYERQQEIRISQHYEKVANDAIRNHRDGFGKCEQVESMIKYDNYHYSQNDIHEMRKQCGYLKK